MPDRSTQRAKTTEWTAVAHVPRSQVWQGSRGGHRAHVHLHAPGPFLCGRLARDRGQTLCGKKRGWYERPPEGDEPRCPQCSRMAESYSIGWPT